MAMADLPPSPCPSPSPLSSARSPFHYPTGPSSRFHISDRRPPLHARYKSTFTTPTSPQLSTERRAAHRRTQSTAQVTSIHAQGALTTPPSSEYSRSPLLRYASTSSMASVRPMTPAKRDMRLQDSPFSDYFTDDGRSPVDVTAGAAAYDAPSSETQQMLGRLHKLQAQLMRSSDVSERDALNVVGRKLGEIDAELEALHSQTRMPLDMEDSGLFVDDDEEPPPSPSPKVSSPAKELEYHDLTPENKIAEQDYQLLELQSVLDAAKTANAELRKSYEELVKSHDKHIQQSEDRQQEVERLQTENEELRSDLGFDHSELLFLKLQMKSIKVEVGQAAEDGGEDGLFAWRDRTLEESDRWHTDWRDVDARFRRRRSKYGVLSAEERQRASKKASRPDEVEEDAWRLETVKKVRGMVDSITITRIESGAHQPPPGPTDGVEEQAEAGAEDVHTQPPSSAPKEYASNGTQTEAESEPEAFEQDSEYDYEDDESDCAITTSPNTPEQQSPVIRGMVPSSKTKTAWKELWEGLSSLAGMADSDAGSDVDDG
ncbi:hypothetical protein LTR10_008918 [Elasticomyces elasticus]|nr:hypothetical protein LTR10_008918 [Elasticomyces elasticus]KAK4974109.1 hypothetical protein LTR42_004748 [Elasticomyces elasticus]